MPATMASLRGLLPRYRVQAELCGIALLLVIAAIVVGKAARRNATAMTMELARLRASGTEVTEFRGAFRPDSVARDSARLPDSLAVAVSHDARISLAQRVASVAEGSGLSNVRVRFANPDTASAPSRPDLAASPVLANYTIAVHGEGRFGAMLSLVKRLPPSVALQRVTVVRRSDGGADYELVLAVFETTAQKQHG